MSKSENWNSDMKISQRQQKAGNQIALSDCEVFEKTDIYGVLW